MMLLSAWNQTVGLLLELQSLWHGSMPQQALCLFKAICRLDMPASIQILCQNFA